MYFRVMETTLENLSKLELVTLLIRKEESIQQYQKEVVTYQGKVVTYQGDIAYYKARIAQLERMLYGQKRERFEGENNQPPLLLRRKQSKSKSRESNLVKR